MPALTVKLEEVRVRCYYLEAGGNQHRSHKATAEIHRVAKILANHYLA